MRADTAVLRINTTLGNMKITTYNIDGLPETLDLKTLPWILRPIAWLYKWFKGTTIITLNDNSGRAEATVKIGQSLRDTDIAVFQEDFNYHNELCSNMPDRNWGTFQGPIDLSKIFSMVKGLRWKADGLGLALSTKMSIYSEDMIEWKDSCGYFSHFNDKLTRKGFRRYCICPEANSFANRFVIYVVHNDASAYNPDPKDVEARRKQFAQLVDYIKNNETYLPLIIIGDTNCTTLPVDQDTIKECLITPLQEAGYDVSEALPNEDVDRIFVANHYSCKPPYKIVINSSSRGTFDLSDHSPFTIDFDIIPLNWG